MLFNSLEYLVFLPVVAIIYFLIPHRFRWLHLLAASCFFYMSLIPYYIIFVSITILNDYSAACLIERYPDRKKIFIWQSVSVNIGILFVFKYYNFFVDNVAAALAIAGINVSMPLLQILMPIGLSFYTFKSIGYVIEVYRENIKAEKHLGKYALYVLFFPEILAGPIDRGDKLLPQFSQVHKFDYKRITDGLKLIAWGAFKKVVIADRIGLLVDHVYRNLNDYSGVPLLITAVLFSFQIYFDFSGYSDIAIGSGKILGLNMPENFNVPLISQSITEFWRRWHISLSTWLRDYLFTPIAFATRAWGKYSVVFALFVTFLLAGMWHGTGWTFIIFGALHGGALVYELLSKNLRKKISKALPAVIYDKFCVLLAFSFLSFAFIFFRSENLLQAEYFISHMFANLSFKLGGYSMGLGQFEFLLVLLLIIFAMFAEIRTMKSNGVIAWVSAKPAAVRWGIYYAVVLIILCFGVFGEYSFVYFKF